MKQLMAEAICRAALSGDRAQLESLIRQEIAGLKAIDRGMAAKKLDAILRRYVGNTARVVELPCSDLIHWESPERPLDSISLPPVVVAELRLLIREAKAGDVLAEHDLRPRRSIFLHGPTGNGKTSIAKAVAMELSLPLGIVSLSQVVDSYMGETTKNLDRILSSAEKQDCVLFIDEADAIAAGRESGGSGACRESNRTVSSLLVRLDQLAPTVLLIAATNMPEMIDPAVRRRFDLDLEIPSPSESDLRSFALWVSKQRPSIRTDVSGLTLGTCYAAAERAVLDHQRRWVLEQAS